MSLTDQVGLLASRVATEFNLLRGTSQFNAKLAAGQHASRFKANGPLSTDFVSVNLGAPGDAISYNQQFAIINTLPANWPVDQLEGLNFVVYQYFQYGYGSANFMPISYRVMCDGDRFCFYAGDAGNATANYGAMIYIDGVPTSRVPYELVTGRAAFNTIIFPDARVRLIEVRTAGALGGVYTDKPYRLWKPPPRQGPRVLFMGDSYSAGYYCANSLNGMYHNIGPMIGTEDVWLDGIGGTGYGVGSAGDGTGTNRYLDRVGSVNVSGQIWDISNIQPDVLVVHGGGANDLYKGRTVAQVIADATSLFTTARQKCPTAKLVFVEGFAPPGFTPSVFNPNYIAVRQGVQAALTDIGVYYIDVATTAPWIDGTGRSNAAMGDGNADYYIGGDGVHPNDAGHLYIRNRMAPKLRQIIADDGSLVNALI